MRKGRRGGVVFGYRLGELGEGAAGEGAEDWADVFDWVFHFDGGARWVCGRRVRMGEF